MWDDMWDEAIKELRAELRQFRTDGLEALLRDFEAAREDVSALPGRRTWNSCPLSYRLGYRGSTDRDSQGRVVNAFTLAWDGHEPEGEYLPEELVIGEVKAELKRRGRRFSSARCLKPTKRRLR